MSDRTRKKNQPLDDASPQPGQPRSLSFRVSDSVPPEQSGDGSSGRPSVLDRLKQKVWTLRKREPEIYPLW